MWGSNLLTDAGMVSAEIFMAGVFCLTLLSADVGNVLTDMKMVVVDMYTFGLIDIHAQA